MSSQSSGGRVWMSVLRVGVVLAAGTQIMPCALPGAAQGAAGDTPLVLPVPAATPSALGSPAATRSAGVAGGSRAPAAAAAGWPARVQREIVESEYRPSWQDVTVLADVAGAWQAPNRAQGFRTYFTDRGIRVVPRAEEAPSWEWGLELTAWGWTGDPRPAAPARPLIDGDAVCYTRGPLNEWYRNHDRGLEQSFTLAHAPDGQPGRGAELVLELALHGRLAAYPAEDGRSLELAHGGARVLRYAEIGARDAAGTSLPVRLLVTSHAGDPAVRIVVETRHAVWPVTVEALASSPSWMVESDQPHAGLGISTASAGDVNGDGYADVLVAASQYDDGQADEGRVFVYHGSAAGLEPAPAWTADGGQAGANLGTSVAAAGDVNGDGWADVIVGAPGYDDDETDEGRAWVYHGSATGLATSPAWSADGDQAGAAFGCSVASAGDVDGDGYGDVIVGARGRDHLHADEGRAVVYHGSASGLATSPSWTADGDQENASFGASVASAGDVNGDGFADVIVGAPNHDGPETDGGRASVYLGAAGGLEMTPSWTADGDQEGAFLGVSVAAAGDVDGDGFADVIVGAHSYDSGDVNEGRAFVYHGGAAGLAPTPGWTADGNQASAYFGGSVAAAGDVNGDGYADVIVGALGYSNGESYEGRAFVYHGSAAGLAAPPSWTAEIDQALAFFGVSVAAAGDVNGDGYGDVVVGAHGYDGGETDEGCAVAYHGSAAGLTTAPVWSAQSTAMCSSFGDPVASAGDVNGDGSSDVIVGARAISGGRAFVYHGGIGGLASSASWTGVSDQQGAAFGAAVASAGDVNGDGYGDVIVGAPGYDGGQTDEGRAFVYHGSATGLAATPSWTAESDLADAAFGSTVASAGDVNGDGYGDVVVGAHLYGGSGRVYVYHGSAAGLAASAAWYVDGDHAGASFGRSVASAGDVDGDGYADVAVGAPLADGPPAEAGRAFLFHGSATGLATVPSWSAAGDQAGAHFGSSLASAGDVNGDGHADLVVGAPLYDDVEADAGRAWVFHGSPAGLATTHAWTVAGATAEQLGTSVAGAGDVNGDGYADVVLGAPFYDEDYALQGRAWVFHGSAAGLGASPAWIGEGTEEFGYFGPSVASAGDVNGDGSADLVVGAPGFCLFLPVARAFVYHGNGGRGRLVATQQLQGGGSSTVQQPWGTAAVHDEVQVRAHHSSAAGRERVAGEVEACPAGVPFASPGCIRASSPSWSDSTATPDGVSLTTAVPGLAPATLYRWRERTLRAPFTVTRPGVTPPPNPAHGPWRRLGAQAVEADIRTGAGIPDAIFADGFESGNTGAWSGE